MKKEKEKPGVEIKIIQNVDRRMTTEQAVILGNWIFTNIASTNKALHHQLN